MERSGFSVCQKKAVKSLVQGHATTPSAVIGLAMCGTPAGRHPPCPYLPEARSRHAAIQQLLAQRAMLVRRRSSHRTAAPVTKDHHNR